MYCGSCLHDNTLAAALNRLGQEVVLIPTYTPIRTDEEDVSASRVFFGGINVYLQQKSAIFRHTPWFLDRLFDVKPLLRWVSRFAFKTQGHELGELTVSMLQGEHGRQRKEINKLVHWLATHVQPDLINLSNVLLSGVVEEMKRRLRKPVLCSLQGDDIFLEALPEPFRSQALDLIRAHCRHVDGFIATSRYYADFMSEYLSLPPSKIEVVYPGINLALHDLESSAGMAFAGDGEEATIGYFARICPEKGFHLFAEAARILQRMPGVPRFRLRASGWLGKNDRPYYEKICRYLHEAQLGDRFEYVDSPDHVSKVRFLRGLYLLSVPTTYREPKGLYVLEALANGVPVIQPGHGAFPELIEATGGGLLVPPNHPEELAKAWYHLLQDRDYRNRLAEKGREAVHRQFDDATMAEKTMAVYQRYVSEKALPISALDAREIQVK
ncbi:MAG: glycosyl transferase family 1 [Gemmatales bacterium]|nr:MAG: glycosyl transferase family 1 [Gemmatales bacterium]